MFACCGLGLAMPFYQTKQLFTLHSSPPPVFGRGRQGADSPQNLGPLTTLDLPVVVLIGLISCISQQVFAILLVDAPDVLAHVQ